MKRVHDANPPLSAPARVQYDLGMQAGRRLFRLSVATNGLVDPNARVDRRFLGMPPRPPFPGVSPVSPGREPGESAVQSVRRDRRGAVR